jgi:hypothetical protein
VESFPISAAQRRIVFLVKDHRTLAQVDNRCYDINRPRRVQGMGIVREDVLKRQPAFLKRQPA